MSGIILLLWVADLLLYRNDLVEISAICFEKRENWGNDYWINSKIFFASKTMLKDYPWVHFMMHQHVVHRLYYSKIIDYSIVESSVQGWGLESRIGNVMDAVLSMCWILRVIIITNGEQAKKLFWKSFHPVVWFAIFTNDKESLALLWSR